MITTVIRLIQPLSSCLIKQKVFFFFDALNTHSFETRAPIFDTSRSMTSSISTFFVFKHVFYMVQEMIMLMTMLTSPVWEARVSLNTFNWSVEFFIFHEEIVAEWILLIEIVTSLFEFLCKLFFFLKCMLMSIIGPSPTEKWYMTITTLPFFRNWWVVLTTIECHKCVRFQIWMVKLMTFTVKVVEDWLNLDCLSILSTWVALTFLTVRKHVFREMLMLLINTE